ncbi:hypothetical protein DFH11DRAFT_832000 [Phellopilus nigrolimitatus]|nr:hypothetical protein DFH11DRAFT_832000 [Phellopilus nigrolimitatus]
MDFPPEILDRIFEMNEFKSHRHTRFDDFSAKREHVPLIRVCRSWRPVAERRLYRAIPLFCRGYGRPGPLPATYVEKRHWQLCRTLQGNASLAAHVRELYLDLDACENEKARVYLKIMNLCPNLSHLTIKQYKAYDLVRLKRVFAAKSLVKLAISAHDKGPAMPLLSSKELLQMMTMWPMTEDICLDPNVLVSSYDRRYEGYVFTGDQHPTETNLSQSSCPELRSLKLGDALLSACDLHGLRAISFPRLQRFSARIMQKSDIQAALATCLKTWSPHLLTLTIDYTFECNVEPRQCTRLPIDDAVMCLSSLRFLSINALLVCPQTILALSALQYINYFMPTAEELDALTLGLTVSDTGSTGQAERRMPALRFLCIVSPMGERGPHCSDKLLAAEKRLQATCETRDVDFNCVGKPFD